MRRYFSGLSERWWYYLSLLVEKGGSLVDSWKTPKSTLPFQSEILESSQVSAFSYFSSPVIFLLFPADFTSVSFVSCPISPFVVNICLWAVHPSSCTSLLLLFIVIPASKLCPDWSLPPAHPWDPLVLCHIPSGQQSHEGAPCFDLFSICVSWM